MRKQYLFNHDWLYIAQEVGAEVPDQDFEIVNLPHTNVILPYHNFDDQEYQFISTYRKRFQLPEALNGRRLFLDFEGAMIAAKVSLNGHQFPEHCGGYVPFSFDITDYVDPNGENTLVVHLDSHERKDIPPFGYVVDYMTFGGIYRDVHLRYVSPTFIENVRVKATQVLTDTAQVSVDVYVRNLSDASQAVSLAVTASEPAFEVTAQATATDQQTTKVTLTGEVPMSADKLWSIQQPRLFDFVVNLNGDEAQDSYPVRFGFREAGFRDDGFYLNGERLQLRGMNRHQTYPYIGAAAPARLQRKDADIVKYELGCNIVRTSHYPQSIHFLNRCDEIGLLVFEEIPGWQFIGDEAWKQLALRDVRAMIERDWNHPSIIIWGVRINESWDDDEFYTRTNALARQLDPTRPTGGVRFWLESSFLEDVYTFNDFSKGVMEPTHTPHLITEFNGHMFPTKTFDNEERRIEHALRHAKIQAQAASTGGVSGAIAWCAFDYNTHKEFGSGDRICYHGVMDIFRLPKYAAKFYESQISPDERIILSAATLWSMGDRSEGGNDPLTIFSNCEQVEIFAGAERIGLLEPDHEQYPNLPHPPFFVRGLGMRWGEAFGDLKVIGYIGGKAVAEQNIRCDAQPRAIQLKLDDEVIQADGIDMTRLSFMIVDNFGNTLPYTTKIVKFEIVSGEAELIGDTLFASIGGQGALYVKSTRTPSTVTIRASAPRLETVEVQLKIQ